MILKQQIISNIILLFSLVSACGPDSGNVKSARLTDPDRPVYYYCPMDTQIVKQEEGNCPICKMKLEPLPPDLRYQLADPTHSVISSQSSIYLTRDSAVSFIKAIGYLAPDPDGEREIALSFSGKIEKIYINYNGQYVAEGSRIIDVSSPELVRFQEDHLLLLSLPENDAVRLSSREKLIKAGLSDELIGSLELNRTVKRIVPVHATSGGFIRFGSGASTVENNTRTESMSMPGPDETNSSIKPPNSNWRPFRGSTFEKGQILFKINSNNKAWVMVSLPSAEYDEIDMTKSVSVIPSNEVKHPVPAVIHKMIWPISVDASPMVTIHLDVRLDNHKMALYEWVPVYFQRKTNSLPRLPAEAVFNSGLHTYVWVKTGKTSGGNSVFTLREITTGKVSNGWYPVINGLREQEAVASHASLLTDNETLLSP